MPRTTTLETPGCPPLRALTFDNIGLIKVIEARSKQNGVPKVVDRWGDPNSSKAVLTASINHSLLAVARRNGAIEVLSPNTGESCFSISHDDDATSPIDDPIVGLHLFKQQTIESSPRSCTWLTCTTKGKASLRRIEDFGSDADAASCTTPETWNVCGSGEIHCSKVHADEGYSVFGGKGVELNMWDLENATKIWSAKPPPKNSLGIFVPTWFTSVTFLSKDDHRKVVAGTSNHQVRLYDSSAQRRPVLSIDFREKPIKAVTEDLDGNTIYVGTGAGDLASFDIRTGKLLGCFLGKCSGSIRSISRHPEHSVIASCGLDSYLRFWDINSRQLLSSVFLKQHLTKVVFDSNFTDEETSTVATDLHKDEVQVISEEQSLNEDDAVPVKRKKSSKERSEGKKKKSKKSKKIKGEVDDDDV